MSKMITMQGAVAHITQQLTNEHKDRELIKWHRNAVRAMWSMWNLDERISTEEFSALWEQWLVRPDGYDACFRKIFNQKKKGKSYEPRQRHP